MMIIDLRSDTVTKPNLAMKEAMFNAEVGDDVFGDDPTVVALEKMAADLFGMESALFCSSGTQTNQLAIKSHVSSGSEVICDKLSHIYLYEGGGIASNSLASVRLLNGDFGRINANMILENINNPEDIHLPITSLVSLENTVNKGGGCYYDFAEISKIKDVCQQKGLPLHLDGARLFNALVETKESPKIYGEVFDSISICLSKGLGCPVGSLLLGKKEFIKKAKRARKVMGGGWRQAGYLAAAGIYALQNNVERLLEDHIRAKAIETSLSELAYVKSIMPVYTNIVIFELIDTIKPQDFVLKASEMGIKLVQFGPQHIRMVCHLDFDDVQLDYLITSLKKIY
jgi:threonine aldolase